MTEDAKAIACIGWGSLVHSPGTLPLLGSWQNDGPSLPVEFARQSENGRITLVVCPGVPRVQTCWALLDVADLAVARHKLAVREYKQATTKWTERSIGFWDRAAGTSFGLEAETITAWAHERGLAGVVWTNLPCKFGGINGRMPDADQVIAYLRGLAGDVRRDAEEYVRKAPAQIDTPYRRAIAEALGWTTLS